MMDNKLACEEKTRAAFERWAEQSGALPWGILKKHRNQDGSYPGPHYTYMWHAWSACHEALTDVLEAAEKQIAEFDQRIRTQNRHACELFDEAKSQRQRVAELEASHSKLRESMAAIHNTIRLDGVHTSLAVILNAAKRAHEESAAAAGNSIKGESLGGQCE